MLGILSALALACSGRPAAADQPAVALQALAGGLALPTCIANAGDGTGRLFVCEQGGRLRIVAGGVLRPQPFLDISARVSCCGEQGLLSVAFPDGYAAGGRFYVNYTDTAGDTVVARFRVGADPNVADGASEEVVLRVDQPYSNHNGGQLQFGPDGYLYVGMGDGGSGGDPGNRAQNPAQLLGKMLRIDVESGAATYAVPDSNPFHDTPGFRPEIWALGLRNPWRFSFDRATGDLWIGDVGQNAWEEIDLQPAASGGGENYGWRVMEGAHCYGAATCASSGMTPPVAEYDHGQGCSVTGGYVYRGAAFPRLLGTYLYGDYCSGTVWALRREGASWASAPVLSSDLAISTFGEDEAGELYVADLSGGELYHVIDAAPGCALGCSASVPATAVPDTEVAFSGGVTASGCFLPVSFAWDYGDGSPAAPGQATSHAYSTSGTFAWRLTASSGDASCNAGGTIVVRSRIRRALHSH